MSETNRKRPLLGTCLCAKQSAIGSQTRSFSQQTVIAQLVVAQRGRRSRHSPASMVTN